MHAASQLLLLNAIKINTDTAFTYTWILISNMCLCRLFPRCESHPRVNIRRRILIHGFFNIIGLAPIKQQPFTRSTYLVSSKYPKEVAINVTFTIYELSRYCTVHMRPILHEAGVWAQVIFIRNVNVWYYGWLQGQGRFFLKNIKIYSCGSHSCLSL